MKLDTAKLLPDVTPDSSWADRIAYAEENDRLANSMWDYIFPPWRWLEWFRRRDEVLRRLEVSKRARGVA